MGVCFCAEAYDKVRNTKIKIDFFIKYYCIYFRLGLKVAQI